MTSKVFFVVVLLPNPTPAPHSHALLGQPTNRGKCNPKLFIYHFLFSVSSTASERAREHQPTTIREELPLVDPPKVTLHDDIPYVEPLPYTIQLPSCCPVNGGSAATTLNGGRCNHMGGGDVIANTSGGGGETTIIFGATGIPTCTVNGVPEGGESGTGEETGN